MIYIFGTRNYGYADRVPGLGHVITQFGHFAGRDRGVQLAAALGIDRISAEEMLANMQGK